MTRILGCSLVLVCLGLNASACAAPRQHGGVRSAAPGYLGIDVRDVNDDEIIVLKLKDAHGAEITKVDHDGPAGKMGLRDRDVIVQMNGAAIESKDQIRRMLRDTLPGRTVAFVICRDGLQMTVTGQMADHTEVERQAWEQHLSGPSAQSPQAPSTGLPSDDPTSTPGQPSTSAPATTSKYSKSFIGTILMTPAYTGVMMERMGPQLADFFGVPKGTGLLVKSVDNNSPAAVAGIRAGDVVVRANLRSVANLTDWTKTISAAKGRPVSVVVLRDHGEKTFTLMPEAKKHSELVLPPVPGFRRTEL